MNVYGYIPANCFPSHSTLTYWAQAASFAGLASCEPTLTSSGLVLGLKTGKLSLTSGDARHKSRNALSPTVDDQLASMFRVAPRVTSFSTESVASLTHHAHIHHHYQQQQLRQQQNQHHSQQHHLFATSPPLGNGLAPLQALCDSDVSAFTIKTSAANDGFSSANDANGSLKFGISRILSDDFGKTRCEKENNFQLSSVPESCRSLTLCPCNSVACTAYARPPSPYNKGSLPSLSAVHALQPPTYPLSNSTDALPGPYSILSADSSFPNQPKRKRSWSRAVFSNLQRKGLEKRFEVQKYVTKPDRRQLAAMLGLTDAQVKVWFQNRRMKWRHSQQQGEKDKQIQQTDHQQGSEHMKQNSSNYELKTSEQMLSRDSTAEDIIETYETADEMLEDTHTVHATEVESSTCNGSRSEPPFHLQVRDGCCSPQDLSVRVYVSECPQDSRLCVMSSLNLTLNRSVEADCNYKLTEDHCPIVSKPPESDGTVVFLRHKLPSLGDDDESDHLLGPNVSFSHRSPPALELYSDVDVNDTDVDMNDTDDTDDAKREVRIQASHSKLVNRANTPT